jgi:hypothetical protein
MSSALPEMRRRAFSSSLPDDHESPDAMRSRPKSRSISAFVPSLSMIVS